MADTIELRGLRVVSYCGLLPEEEVRAQPFEIDIDIDLDVSQAAKTGDLDQTIDYGGLVDSVARVARGRYGLLEAFATDIATLVLENPIAQSTRVTVRKLRPPVAHDLASSGVTVRRTKP